MTEEVRSIGAVLAAIPAHETRETDFSALSTVESTAPMIRLDDRQLKAMEAIASAPLPAPARCPDDHFAKSMRALSMLPRRGDDETTGELRAAIYQRVMGHYPLEAIKFLTERALTELEWFPSPKQCLDILSRWKRNDEPLHRQIMAQKMVRAELTARFEENMVALAARELDQAAIEALPPMVRIIAAERGYLRLHDDGVFRVRHERDAADAARPKEQSNAA